MKSLKLIVRGIVQKVGYRNDVYHTARKLKLKGYVKNLDDPEESVEILAQHENPAVLEEFIGKIRINDGFIEVEEIARQEVQEEPRIKFEIIRGSSEEENAERLDVAEVQLKRLTHTVYTGDLKLHEGNQKLHEGNQKLHEDNQQVIGKLDSMDSQLVSFSSNTSSRFDTVDHKYGKISDKLEEISVSLNKLVSVLERFAPKK